MENRLTLIVVTTLLVALSPAGLFAYEPNSTHDALTYEVANFYNVFASEYGTPTLSDEYRTLLQKGAMAEDDNYRMAHHFYDPVRNIGLKQYMSSKTWAQSPAYQASWSSGPGGCLIQPHVLFPLFESPCDRSWQRAIYEYTYGDRKNAMEALGHTLHLIEDATVPDHTRDDAHIPIFDKAIQQYDENFGESSPFEEFADQFSLLNKNVDTAKKLLSEGANPHIVDTLDIYFDNTASYSNSNFFSKSTIFDKNYSLPVIENLASIMLSTGDTKSFGKHKDHFFVQIETTRKLDGTKVETYDIQDADKIILSNYWQLTSREAVKNGAGVIRLFFLEVEKEKQTGTLLRMKEPLLKQAGVAGVRAVAVAGNTGSRLIASLIRRTGTVGKFAAGGVTKGIAYVGNTLNSANENVRYAIWKEVIPTDADFVPQTKPITENAVDNGRTTVVVSDTQQPQHSTLLAALEKEITRLTQLIASIRAARVTPPSTGEVAGAATVVSPYEVTANSLGGGGGGSGTVIFLADASVATPPVLPVATTSEEVIVPKDLTAPDAPLIHSPIVHEVIATTSVLISGTAEGGAVVALSWLMDTVTVVFETRATSTGEWSAQVLLPFGTTTIGVVAIDDAGNSSSPVFRDVVVVSPLMVVPPSQPVTQNSRVLFNEIAWGGTEASPDDEWIELYNAGDAPADLSQYSIRFHSVDTWSTTPLTGILGPGDYFVVANSSGVVEPQVPASIAYPMLQPWIYGMAALPETGMELELIDSSMGTDMVIDHIPLCVDWCGNGAVGVSMERWRSELDTAVWENWDSNNGNFSNGLDRNGNGILGTPGARNSLNYSLALTSTIEGMQTFAKGQGAYVLFSTLTIPADSSLTLGAGTVVKWMPSSGKLVVRGALRAYGDREAAVVFTSIDDDSAGGDTLGDGVQPVRRNNSVQAIAISGAVATAEFNETEIRYAGTALHLTSGASATLVSTTISDSQHAMYLHASTLSGTDTSFYDITGNSIVAFASSSITLASTTVARTGSDAFVLFDGTALALTDTTFTGVSGIGIDAFGSSVNATNTVFADVHVTKNAIDLFTNRAGKASNGNFNGVTVQNMGEGDIFNMIGSRATVTDLVAKNGKDDAITLTAGSALVIASSTIENFRDTAILSFGSTVNAKDVMLVGNNYGVRSFNSVVDVESSVITENTTAGVANATPTIGTQIDATGNYWGNILGPTSPSMPSGSVGDAVTAGVLFDPFLTTAPL